MCQHMWDPLKHSYYHDDYTLTTSTKVPPAPQAILELIKCQCGTHCTTQRCSCQKHTWLAQTSVCVELTVEMTQTVTLNMTLKTVMKIYTNISSKWYRPSRSYVYNLYYYLVTGMSVLLLYRTIPKTNYIRQVNRVKLADIMFSLLCVSVRTAKMQFVTTSLVFAVKM